MSRTSLLAVEHEQQGSVVQRLVVGVLWHAVGPVSSVGRGCGLAHAGGVLSRY